MVTSPRSETSGTVVWTERFLGYTWSPEHPMKPARLQYTMSLAESLGLLDGVEPLAPDAATQADLMRVHSSSYIEAVRRAGQGPPTPEDVLYG
ncbi:acetoin utilization protein AcuC, partial [Nocardia sp. NPDC060220]